MWTDSDTAYVSSPVFFSFLRFQSIHSLNQSRPDWTNVFEKTAAGRLLNVQHILGQFAEWDNLHDLRSHRILQPSSSN